MSVVGFVEGGTGRGWKGLKLGKTMEMGVVLMMGGVLKMVSLLFLSLRTGVID